MDIGIEPVARELLGPSLEEITCAVATPAELERMS